VRNISFWPLYYLLAFYLSIYDVKFLAMPLLLLTMIMFVKFFVFFVLNIKMLTNYSKYKTLLKYKNSFYLYVTPNYFFKQKGLDQESKDSKHISKLNTLKKKDEKHISICFCFKLN
jgi:hypothetical protein